MTSYLDRSPPKRDFVTRTNSTYRIRIYWKDSRIGKIATGGGGGGGGGGGFGLKVWETPLAEAEHLDVTPADVP